MTIKDLPKHLRPREKLSGMGASNLTDTELLAIILRTGSVVKDFKNNGKIKTTKFNAIELANYLIQEYGLRRLFELSFAELIQVPGINHTQACSILAAGELVNRAFQLESEFLPEIQSTRQALTHLTELSRYRKEYLVVLYLNAKCQLIHKEDISVGILNASLIHPREVFEPAIRHSCCSLILSHNHPSGDPQPSPEDRKVTEQLVEAGKVIGIEVLDHLIVGKNSYFSFLEHGLLQVSNVL
ncbi:MAG: DNA repair protein RadC [Patescibacteria group bacterium]